MKYAGALYLVALGTLMLWRARASGYVDPVAGHAAPAPGSRLVLHAAMTGALNPKVAVFFLAFLPQFVRPERGAPLAQFLVLGLVLSALGLIVDASLAVIAGTRTHEDQRQPGLRSLARTRHRGRAAGAWSETGTA